MVGSGIRGVSTVSVSKGKPFHEVFPASGKMLDHYNGVNKLEAGIQLAGDGIARRVIMIPEAMPF
jgi:hypothetical protein